VKESDLDLLNALSKAEDDFETDPMSCGCRLAAIDPTVINPLDPLTDPGDTSS